MVPDQEAHGIEAPDKIDTVALSPDQASVQLMMAQTIEWDGSDRLLLLPQAKWKNYLAFAVDGQLARTYPEYSALPWKIILWCQSEPDPRTKEFVRRAAEATRQEGGDFLIWRRCESSG